MYLYLVRHGIAIERHPDIFDSNRYLTADGRKKIKKAYPVMSKELTEGTIIWSSPLVRAVQTAEILAQSCKLNDVLIHDFIASGSFQDFVYELYLFLSDNEKEDKGPVVIVGHEPYLSYWTHCLVGESLHYKKGSISKIEIDLKGKSLSDEKELPFDAEFMYYKRVKDLNSLNEKKKNCI